MQFPVNFPVSRESGLAPRPFTERNSVDELSFALRNVPLLGNTNPRHRGTRRRRSLMEKLQTGIVNDLLLNEITPGPRAAR